MKKMYLMRGKKHSNNLISFKVFSPFDNHLDKLSFVLIPDTVSETK